MRPSDSIVYGVLIALTGCGSADPVDVIDPALWELVLPDPIDPSVTCGELAMTMEEGLVEVDTGECNHVTLEQPALAGVRVDDALDVFAFHSALSAPEPGEGRIALWLDGELTWERTPPIPSSEAIYLDTVDSPVRIRRGDPVRLHISNHGGNSWRFVSLERQ